MRTLKRGLSGDDVRLWQAFLISEKHLDPGNAIGKFGPKTHAATKEFQTKHRLEKVDGIVGKKTLAKAVELGFVAPPDPESLTGTGLSDGAKRILAAVHPKLRERIFQLEAIAAQQNPPIIFTITSGLRTFAEQDALFAKGRNAAGKIIDESKVVTFARAGESNHNYGLAIDMVPLKGKKANWDVRNPAWRFLGKEGKQLGLEWGGDWTRPVDLPHLQLKGLSVAECQRLHRRGGIPAVWAEMDRILAST